MTGQRIDHYVLAAAGTTVDLGWGTAVWNAEDRTVTRTCKGCSVSVTSPVDAHGTVAPRYVHHHDDCTVVDRLGNNPVLS